MRPVSSSARVAVAIALGLSGCVQLVEIPPPAGDCDPPCFAEQGWEAYAERDWSQVALFRSATNLDPDFAEGWMGLGYFHVELGRVSLAADEFELAAELDTSLVAAFAGAAFTLASQGDDAGAVLNAEEALRRGGAGYVFEHNPAINSQTIHLLLADVFFRNQNYASAQTEINIVLPGNGLDPQSRTYVSDMLQLLVQLRAAT